MKMCKISKYLRVKSKSTDFKMTADVGLECMLALLKKHATGAQVFDVRSYFLAKSIIFYPAYLPRLWRARRCGRKTNVSTRGSVIHEISRSITESRDSGEM